MTICQYPIPLCPKLREFSLPCAWQEFRQYVLMRRAAIDRVPESLFAGKQSAVSPAVDTFIGQGNRGVTRVNLHERKKRKQQVVAIIERPIYYIVAGRLLELAQHNGIPRELVDEHAHRLIVQIIYQVDVTSEPWNPQSPVVTEQVNKIVTKYVADMRL